MSDTPLTDFASWIEDVEEKGQVELCRADVARALERDRSELLAALDFCRFALEPYDDLKPRDWGTDREHLRRAHELARTTIANVTGRDRR